MTQVKCVGSSDIIQSVIRQNFRLPKTTWCESGSNSERTLYSLLHFIFENSKYRKPKINLVICNWITKFLASKLTYYNLLLLSYSEYKNQRKIGNISGILFFQNIKKNVLSTKYKTPGTAQSSWLSRILVKNLRIKKFMLCQVSAF